MSNQNISKKIKSLVTWVFKNSDFSFTRELIKQIPNAQIYLVGGYIRDYLLGVPSKDFDFVVTGMEKKKLENFLKKYGEVADVDSRAFGVFKFKPKNYSGDTLIDIALSRKESQIGPGHKDFSVCTSAELKIEDDLSRRDFTINALAINLKNQKLVDNFDGIADLENKIIKAVGKPEERFIEDPSRILRAIRLSCQLGFEIEPKTFSAAKKLSLEITKTFIDSSNRKKTRVSEEIIASEFLKGFNKNYIQLIRYYNELGILKQILPELEKLKNVEQPQQFHSEGDVWEHTILALKNLKPKADINLKIAVLFHDIGKPDTQTFPKNPSDRIRFNEHDEKSAEIFIKIYNHLKFSAPFPKNNPLYPDKKEIVWLINNHMLCTIRRPEKMRLGTIEKYFFKNEAWGKNLLALIKADILATVPPDGNPDFTNYNKIVKRIKEAEKSIKEQKKERKLTKEIPLIADGKVIQKIFNIKPSPLVGSIKDLIRYLQLEGELKSQKDVERNKELIKKVCEAGQKSEEDKTKIAEAAVKSYFELKK
jgi:poly(A) polymerase